MTPLTPAQRRVLALLADGRGYQSRAQVDKGASYHPDEMGRISGKVLADLESAGLIRLDSAPLARGVWRRDWQVTDAGHARIDQRARVEQTPITFDPTPPAPAVAEPDPLADVIADALADDLGRSPLTAAHVAERVRAYLDGPGRPGVELDRIPCACGPDGSGPEPEPDYRSDCALHGESVQWAVIDRGRLRLTLDDGREWTTGDMPRYQWAAGWLARRLAAADAGDDLAGRAFVPPF